MPLITCEMRWLFEGALPVEVARWFERGGESVAETWREDRYLVLPGVTDMGIKERQGRLEIKGRLAKLGSHAIAPEIGGYVERWCKWSYDAAIEARLHSLLQDQGISVAKARAQWHFILDAGCAQQTAQRDLTRRGFSIELTRIRLGDADHWSLGIEAAPDDGALLADLLCTLPAVFTGLAQPLSLTRSQSYPAWLAQGVAGPGRRPPARLRATTTDE
jgi:hypothetical protein